MPSLMSRGMEACDNVWHLTVNQNLSWRDVSGRVDIPSSYWRVIDGTDDFEMWGEFRKRFVLFLFVKVKKVISFTESVRDHLLSPIWGPAGGNPVKNFHRAALSLDCVVLERYRTQQFQLFFHTSYCRVVLYSTFVPLNPAVASFGFLPSQLGSTQSFLHDSIRLRNRSVYQGEGYF